MQRCDMNGSHTIQIATWRLNACGPWNLKSTVRTWRQWRLLRRAALHLERAWHEAFADDATVVGEGVALLTNVAALMVADTIQDVRVVLQGGGRALHSQ